MPSLSKIKDRVQYDLIIIDGKNMAYKYYYAMASLKNKEGEHTGIYHGFLSLLFTLRIAYPKAEVVVAWEGGTLVKRQMLSTYKCKRPEVADSFEVAYHSLQDLLGMLGVVQKYAAGYEADDVAATLVKNYPDNNILLVTEDNDWNQLLRENVTFWRKNQEVTYEAICKQIGFPAERYALYTLLKGKASNNVKGIPFFPTELAIQLLNECDTLLSLVKAKKEEKWYGILIEREEELKKLYSVVKVNDAVRLEDLLCVKKSTSKAKKVLHDLQLFKVMSLMNQLRKMSKSKQLPYTR